VTYNGAAVGRDGLRQFSTTLRVAFPDDRIMVDEMVAEDDLVATSITWSGTPPGGVPEPTARAFGADREVIHDPSDGPVPHP
jgi:predicted ester cyclase